MTTARRRYLTRATDLSQVPAVAAFLRGLGLGDFVPDGLVSHTGRNENWSGTTTSGRAVFVKSLGGEPEDAQRRLRGIIAFEELLEDAPAGTLRAPRCLGWSEEDALVAYEMLPLSRTGAELADAKEFGEGHARQIGEMIGELHGLKPSGRVRLDTSAPSQPSVAAFTALPLESHRTSSAAELRVWSMLQQDAELVEAIVELRRAEAAAETCPTHGDLRLDQLLLSGHDFHLLDCEELRLGDPARDTGAFIGSGSTARSPRFPARHGTIRQARSRWTAKWSPGVLRSSFAYALSSGSSTKVTSPPDGPGRTACTFRAYGSPAGTSSTACWRRHPRVRCSIRCSALRWASPGRCC